MRSCIIPLGHQAYAVTLIPSDDGNRRTARGLKTYRRTKTRAWNSSIHLERSVVEVIAAEHVRIESSQVKPLRLTVNIERTLRRHKRQLGSKVTQHTRGTMGNNTTREPTGEVPDLLYHTLLTVIDFNEDTSGYTQSTYPLGTHTSLPAVKTFAAHALEELNYRPDDFAEYAVRNRETSEDEDWRHGDDVIAYARAPGGRREFVVKLATTQQPNAENLPAAAGGPGETPRLPPSSAAAADPLHYVIRTRIDYDQGRGEGVVQATEIDGVYVRRSDALRAAKGMLGGREEFAQYDERGDDGEEGQWPFGDDVVVHAVAQTGENYTVAVRTVSESHEKHAKKR
jgi:hypothetical protein